MPAPQPDVQTTTRYRLAPGLEIVRLEAGRYQLRSDFVALALSGDSVEVLVELLVALRQPLSLSDILARLPDHKPESLHQQIETFVDEGVVCSLSRATRKRRTDPSRRCSTRSGWARMQHEPR